MPVCQTQHFGEVTYLAESVLEFPAGLPGFETENRFIALELPAHSRLIFLQSTAAPELCFVTLPVLAVDHAYRLQVGEGDLELLGLPVDRQPAIGEDILCLAILTIRETGVSANLLAPVVVNLKTHRAVQAVSTDGSYPIRHPLAEVAPV